MIPPPRATFTAKICRTCFETRFPSGRASVRTRQYQAFLTDDDDSINTRHRLFHHDRPFRNSRLFFRLNGESLVFWLVRSSRSFFPSSRNNLVPSASVMSCAACVRSMYVLKILLHRYRRFITIISIQLLCNIFYLL